MIGKEWKYYFERDFELFRVRMKEKQIFIENLRKRVTVLTEDKGRVSLRWRRIFHLTDLYPIKSENPFLSLMGTDFKKEMLIKFLIKGGELALYHLKSDKLSPLLRMSETFVADSLKARSSFFDISSTLLYCLDFTKPKKDYKVGFQSSNGDRYQFESPVIMENIDIDKFPLYYRVPNYFETLMEYLPQEDISFLHGNTVRGLLTVNKKQLTYFSPLLA